MRDGLYIGDIVVWKFSAEVGRCQKHPDSPNPACTCHTHLKVVDESISKARYDYLVQSPDTGRCYEEREDDLILIKLSSLRKLPWDDIVGYMSEEEKSEHMEALKMLPVDYSPPFIVEEKEEQV